VSFEEFVQGSSPRLFRTALLLTGHDRAAAEDLLQLALERAVLVLRYFSDLSAAEIADELGCSVGTVKSQLCRGLARLRAVAEPETGVPDRKGSVT
jgi:DNA-directed RNA polymerase specialized sigma24 family protein